MKLKEKSKVNRKKKKVSPGAAQLEVNGEPGLEEGSGEEEQDEVSSANNCAPSGNISTSDFGGWSGGWVGAKLTGGF